MADACPRGLRRPSPLSCCGAQGPAAASSQEGNGCHRPPAVGHGSWISGPRCVVGLHFGQMTVTNAPTQSRRVSAARGCHGGCGAVGKWPEETKARWKRGARAVLLIRRSHRGCFWSLATPGLRLRSFSWDRPWLIAIRTSRSLGLRCTDGRGPVVFLVRLLMNQTQTRPRRSSTGSSKHVDGATPETRDRFGRPVERTTERFRTRIGAVHGDMGRGCTAPATGRAHLCPRGCGRPQERQSGRLHRRKL